MVPYVLFATGLVSILLSNLVAAAGNQTFAMSAPLYAEFTLINSTFISLTIVNRGDNELILFGQNSPLDGTIHTWVQASYNVNGTVVYLNSGTCRPFFRELPKL